MTVDCHLKLDGIEGEDTDQNHTNEIRVLSFSYGASQTSGALAGSGMAAGKASAGDLHIVKYFDAASVPLYKNLMQGTTIGTGVLTACKSGGTSGGQPFITITLSEIFVTSLQASGSTEIPTESASFSYKSIKIEYAKQSDQGSMQAVGSVTYDVQANQVS